MSPLLLVEFNQMNFPVTVLQDVEFYFCHKHYCYSIL